MQRGAEKKEADTVFPLSILPLHFLAGMQICHRLSSAAIHKTITYKENAGHFSSDIYTDLRTNQSLLFFFPKEDSMLLSSADTTFRHIRTHAHLHNAAP